MAYRIRDSIAALVLAFVGLMTAPLAAHAQINFGPYVPTPEPIVAEMMKMAEPRPTDFMLDLGSGDGRLVITAAKQAVGLRGMGYDINPELVVLANENAKKAEVADRVKFVRQDLFEADFTPASLITVYLLPSTVTKLVPKMLAEMKPGSRVVSHDYPLLPWQHDQMREFNFQEKLKISGTTRTILFHYTVPARLAGTWELRVPESIGKQARLTLTQQATSVQGNMVVDGRTVPINDFRLKGEALAFSLPGPLDKPTPMRATVTGDAMQGTADLPAGGGAWQGKRVAP